MGAATEANQMAGRRAMAPEGAEFLSVAQAAALVQVCRTTVRGWCRTGRLRRYGEGRIWRVRRVELLELMARGAQAQGEDAVAASILKKAGH